MHMIINFTKGTIQLIALLIVVGALIKLFLKRTLIGRLILVICKDIHLSLKLCFNISKRTIKIIHKDAKKLNNIMYRKYKKFEDKKQEKKVVNGNNNIIDFQQIKKKHR